MRLNRLELTQPVTLVQKQQSNGELENLNVRKATDLYLSMQVWADSNDTVVFVQSGFAESFAWQLRSKEYCECHAFTWWSYGLYMWKLDQGWHGCADTVVQILTVHICTQVLSCWELSFLSFVVNITCSISFRSISSYRYMSVIGRVGSAFE